MECLSADLASHMPIVYLDPKQENVPVQPADETVQSDPVAQSLQTEIQQEVAALTLAAEEVWDWLATAVKFKVRGACLEVLRRTDNSDQNHMSIFEYDDDARFLD